MKRNDRSRSRAWVRVVLASLALALATTPALGAGALEGVVNLNTASVEQLQLLPGVGASRAAAIVALRKQSGGFKSVDQLAEVKGIGGSVLGKLRPFVRLTGKTTAKAN